MCTQATTGTASHLDSTPTSGHNLQHLLFQLKAAEEQHSALVRPQKEYDDYTDADWDVEKQMRDLNMEIHRLGSHIHELEMEQLWEIEQDENGEGGVELGCESGVDQEMQDSDVEEAGVNLDRVESVST
jgi:hypothetical protein